MTDDAAHRAVLGAVLVDPSNAALILDQLTADDFDPGWMQLTYIAIADSYASGLNPDAQAVLAYLQTTGQLRRNDGGIGPFIAGLYADAPFPPEPQRHIAAVLETSYRRQLWNATTRIRQACIEWPLSAVISTVERELTSAMQAASRLAPAPEQFAAPKDGIPGLRELLADFTESPAA